MASVLGASQYFLIAPGSGKNIPDCISFDDPSDEESLLWLANQDYTLRGH